MPAFEYIALDSDGRERSGVIEGENPRHARTRLRDQGLTPVDIRAVGAHGPAGGPRLRARDLALLTRQLATLIEAATPLDEALQTVADQTQRPAARQVLLGIRADVLEGASLADAVSAFPAAFPAYYRASIAAGEESGQLAGVFGRLADDLEARLDRRSQTILALIYPCLLAAVALGVLLALMTWVVPQVVRVFDTLGRELPLLTRLVMGISDFLRQWGLLVLLLAVAGGAALGWLLRRPRPMERWHALQLRLPLIGRLVRGSEIARFARTAGILMNSGVPVVDTLQAARQSLHNRVLRRSVSVAAERVREGGSVHRALEDTGAFPPLALSLIASGERGGRLGEMLDRAARAQEREVTTLSAAVLGVLEPVLIILVGAMVLVIVLAILLPVFELNRLLG